LKKFNLKPRLCPAIEFKSPIVEGVGYKSTQGVTAPFLFKDLDLFVPNTLFRVMPDYVFEKNVHVVIDGDFVKEHRLSRYIFANLTLQSHLPSSLR
jgi:hypothetical protein